MASWELGWISASHHPFQTASTFHMLAGDTAFDVIYNLLSEALEVDFELDEGNSFVSAKVTTHSLGFN